MRAAVLHGPDDLRVEEVDEPAGEVLVRVEAATACGNDGKMLRHGHRVLGPYPSRFGHETAGARLDTGERVLVGHSDACGACAPASAARPPAAPATRARARGSTLASECSPVTRSRAAPARAAAPGAR